MAQLSFVEMKSFWACPSSRFEERDLRSGFSLQVLPRETLGIPRASLGLPRVSRAAGFSLQSLTHSSLKNDQNSTNNDALIPRKLLNSQQQANEVQTVKRA